ncbi:hypothetical protein R5R35_010976 [Gryllus longicercus]|uniref:Ropporin-1-like protein n=1 Tax=Gryllus longicercus TaxID=2509291 RepID=A0AAN9VW51_9ORTH
MPDLVEQMYCSQQIHIPPTFPFILKQYCKAAIRTQPYDLLRWSAAYFRCMANGEPPPVKPRLEYPQTEFPSGLSPGYLRVLLKQFAGKQFVGAHEILRKWRGVSLDENTLQEIFMLGRFETEIDTLKFIAICAAYLCEKLSRTMILLCELLTEEPEGGSAMIPCDTFISLYTYLARMNCGPVLEGENATPPEGWADIVVEESTVEEQQKDMEEEEEEDKEGPEQVLKITDSEPHLTKCISVERTVEDMEATIKNALWDALLSKLPDEDKAHDEDDYEAIKDDLWSSVKRNVDQYSNVAADARDFLHSVIQDIPDLRGKMEKPTADKTTSEILKKAIWDAITEKKPPPSMKGTVWETLSELITDTQKETMKNELWNAVLERIPSGDMSEHESEEPLKYIHREAEAVPSWVGKLVPPYRVEVKGIGPVISEEQIQAVEDYMKYWSDRQEDMVMPRNIRHFLCPPLDPPEDYGFPDDKPEEEEANVDESIYAEEHHKKMEEISPPGFKACTK